MTEYQSPKNIPIEVVESSGSTDITIDTPVQLDPERFLSTISPNGCYDATHQYFIQQKYSLKSYVILLSLRQTHQEPVPSRWPFRA